MREPCVRIERGEVLFSNGRKVGDSILDVDGEYKFFPVTPENGYWPAYMLRDIADLMDEINKPWREMMSEDPQLGG